MTSRNDFQEDNINDNYNQRLTFNPMLYNFRVTPRPGNNKTFALQQPFATLFDNLITVLWSLYGKNSKIQIGVNQLQWALEFMRCMKVDYGYPESMEKIINELEDQLLELYAKIGKKVYETRKKLDLNRDDLKNNNFINSTREPMHQSYNEEDIMGKLGKVNVPIDSTTGEAKYLKELNLLGRRKPKKQDPCGSETSSSKTYMIGALTKLLKGTTEQDTKTKVEELINELKVDNSKSKKTM